MILELEVTQEDIDQGVPGNVTSCALARALSRHFPYAEVDGGGLSVEMRDGKWLRAEVAEAVSDFIDNFDWTTNEVLPASRPRSRMERMRYDTLKAALDMRASIVKPQKFILDFEEVETVDI